MSEIVSTHIFFFQCVTMLNVDYNIPPNNALKPPVTQSPHFSHCYHKTNDTGSSGFTPGGCFFLQAIKTAWTLIPNNCHTLNPSALDFITLTLDSSCAFISLHWNLSNTLWALTDSGVLFCFALQYHKPAPITAHVAD